MSLTEVSFESVLNCKNREFTHFYHYRRLRHKREVHHVFLETVREYAGKVVSYENLEF